MLDPMALAVFSLASSGNADPAGRKLGAVLIVFEELTTERKRAEEKYRSLVARHGRRVHLHGARPFSGLQRCPDARSLGYENRDELLSVEIAQTLYVNPQERERLKRLLQEHGSVNDFEFEIRRKDGELRTVGESSAAIRDTARL